MANAANLRDISQAVTSVSQELAVLMDDVRHISDFPLFLYFNNLIASRLKTEFFVLHICRYYQ